MNSHQGVRQLFFSIHDDSPYEFVNLGLRTDPFESIPVYGFVWKLVSTPTPNGFADHYPYEKWLFHWEYTQHFQTNPYEGVSEHLRWFKYCWTNYLFENEKTSLGVILGPCKLLLISNFPCTDHIIPVNHKPPRSWHNSHRRKWLT